MILLLRPSESRDDKPLDRTRTDGACTHWEDLGAYELAQVGGTWFWYFALLLKELQRSLLRLKSKGPVLSWMCLFYFTFFSPFKKWSLPALYLSIMGQNIASVWSLLTCGYTVVPRQYSPPQCQYSSPISRHCSTRPDPRARMVAHGKRGKVCVSPSREGTCQHTVARDPKHGHSAGAACKFLMLPFILWFRFLSYSRIGWTETKKTSMANTF